VTDPGNPYRAPMARIVKTGVIGPRPFLVFLAAAICWGAGALFLLMTILAVRHFVLTCLDEGWQWFLTHRNGPKFLIFDSLSFYCLGTFMVAGRLFFIRRTRLAGVTLFAALVGIGAMVILFQIDHS
jgi:hypothetical protein